MIISRAPLRINDIGGWTDTWFAEKGYVLNTAVSPCVEVKASVFPNKSLRPDRVLIRAENYGDVFRVTPEHPAPVPHPLLQQAVGVFPVPKEIMLDVSIFCGIPGGSSTGTSASVCVSLIGLMARVTGISSSSMDTAYLAHKVETEKMGLQSGIQDQIAAALGGLCFIDMFRYPQADVTRLDIEDSVIRELDRRMRLIYLGRSHKSSAVHEKIIAFLEKEGPRYQLLEDLKNCAHKARESLLEGDLERFGAVMTENNTCQKALHPDLISRDAAAVIDIAKSYDAAGWKVNGAGGPGGSLTILGSKDDYQRRNMLKAVASLGKGIAHYPVSISPVGLQVWET